MTHGPRPRDLRLAIVYEPEAACAAKLAGAGFPPDIAREVAVYLAQATDLEGMRGELAAGLDVHGIEAEFVRLDDLLARLAVWRDDPVRTIVWALTDGLAYFRGSTVAAAARLAGLPVYGSGAQAQHLCQDKFKCGMLARSAGLTIPDTALAEGRRLVAGDTLPPEGPYFVKPNRLGAKIGVFSDSRTATLEEALALSERIERRYCDRAVIQRYVPGDDVRISVMDLGGPLREAIGLARMVKDPRSETGGAFLTMRDNESLSGSRDTEGAVGAFGATRSIAFTPRMVDLRSEAAGDGRRSDMVRMLEDWTVALADLFALRDYFSVDIRVADDGRPHFLEFETCPAVTIYDFQSYLGRTHGATLAEALSRSVRRLDQRPPDL